MRRLALAFALLSALPIWIVRYAPIEDLPLHLATLRVVHSFHDPAYGFDRELVLSLGRTQYVGYYLLGDLLAHPFGVWGAHRILISLYLSGTVLAMAHLLRSLGRDERGCLFVVPFLYGPLFIIGLFPFLLGIPLLLLSLALCHAHLERPAIGRGLLAAACLVALFFWHIVPFGIAILGTIALAVTRRSLVVWPLAPSIAIASAWVAFTDAGRQVRDTFGGATHRLQPHEAVRDVYAWLGDSFRDHSDEACFGVLVVLIVAGAFASARDPIRVRGWALLPLACAILYVAVGRDHGFMWPIAQRFPMIAALLAIPLLGFPPKRAGVLMTAALAALDIAVIGLVCLHFVRFQAEAAGFDRVLETIPPRQHVASLVFDRASRVAHYAPFLHFGSYYQVEKGGIVEFTFAGYNHWPIDFREGHYPPPGGPARPRWEWTPEDVDPDRDLAPYFDYVIVRGSDLRSECYGEVLRDHEWRVYSRSRSATHGPSFTTCQRSAVPP